MVSGTARIEWSLRKKTQGNQSKAWAVVSLYNFRALRVSAFSDKVPSGQAGHKNDRQIRKSRHSLTCNYLIKVHQEQFRKAGGKINVIPTNLFTDQFAREPQIHGDLSKSKKTNKTSNRYKKISPSSTLIQQLLNRKSEGGGDY